MGLPRAHTHTTNTKHLNNNGHHDAHRASHRRAHQAHRRLHRARRQGPRPNAPSLAINKRGSTVATRALNQPSQDGVLAEKSATLGFNPFAELFCGRLAMMGFTVGLAEEIATGQGILAQINVSAPGVPNPIALAFLTALIVGGTGYGSAKTLASAQNGTMTLRTFKRWCDLLGADQDAVAEKLRVDLTKMESAGKSQADILSTVTKDGSVTFAESDSATALLSMDAKAEAFAAAEKMKAENATVAVSFSTDELDASSPNVNLPPLKPVGGGVSADMKYALDVEMNNGRWAMMGFALAVWTEACTGQGIMGQLVFAAKATGVLGPDSGF